MFSVAIMMIRILWTGESSSRRDQSTTAAFEKTHQMCVSLRSKLWETWCVHPSPARGDRCAVFGQNLVPKWAGARYTKNPECYLWAIYDKWNLWQTYDKLTTHLWRTYDYLRRNLRFFVNLTVGQQGALLLLNRGQQKENVPCCPDQFALCFDQTLHMWYLLSKLINECISGVRIYVVAGRLLATTLRWRWPCAKAPAIHTSPHSTVSFTARTPQATSFTSETCPIRPSRYLRSHNDNNTDYRN